MKNGILIVAVMLGSFPLIHAVAQGVTGQADTLMVIQLEHTKNHRKVILKIGQQVRFMLRTGKAFEHGTITGATDSTITLEIKDDRHVSLSYSDIKAFKIRKSKDNRTGGTVMIVIGGLGTLAGLASLGSGSSSDASGVGAGMQSIGLVAGIIGLPMLIGGIALKSDKTLSMDDTWTAHVSKVIPDTAPSVSSPAGVVKSVKPSPSDGPKLRMKLGVGYGSASSTGSYLAAIEPALQTDPNVLIGLRIEGVLPNGGDNNFKGISTTLNFQYHLSRNKLRAYLGFGAGMFAFGDAAFGFYPRVGLDVGHFFVVADYNIVSVTQPPVFAAPIGSPVPPQPPEEISKYLGFRLGFTLGGPKR